MMLLIMTMLLLWTTWTHEACKLTVVSLSASLCLSLAHTHTRVYKHSHFSTIAEGDEYQFDKTFMDGGGEFHEPNIPFAQKDTEALEDFVSEYDTTNTRIAWPYYEALEPYAEDRALADGPLMSNFRNCDMKAVMCCTTGSLDGAPFTPNAQVCASDLAPGRQSNHMYYGQAFFTDTAPLAHCVGFSWRDGTDSDRFKGNTLYDISYKHFLETKQVGAIPGAPLCGCVDQMPTVTTAACRKVSARGEKLLVTKNADGTLTITQDVGVSVSVEPCTKNGVEVDMVDGYANGGSKNDLKAKIVQSTDCSTARADHLNDQFYVPATENPFETKKPAGVEWAKVAGQGFDFVPGSGLVFNDQDDETAFQQQLKQNLIDGFLDKLDESSSKIIYRHCGTCLPEYQHLFYKVSVVCCTVLYCAVLSQERKKARSTMMQLHGTSGGIGSSKA